MGRRKRIRPEQGEPVRTCVVCRQQAAKFALCRFVLSAGQPQVDRRQRMPGRGAYCCDNGRCDQEFLRQSRRWQRAFRIGKE